MTCTSCGTNLANGDTLCSKCGHPVAPAQSQVSNKEAPRRCVWCFQILKDDEKATCAGCAKVHPDAQRNNTSAAAETEVEATATDKSIGYLLALLVIFAVVMVLKYIVGIISAPDFWGNVALTAGAIALLLFPILFTIWLKGKIGWFAIPVALILLTVGGLSIRYISNKVQVDREVAAAAAKQQLPGNSTFGPEAEPTQAVSPSQRVGTVTEESNCQGYVNQLNQLYRQYDDLGQQSAQCTKDFTAEDCLYNTKAIHDKCGYISDQQAQVSNRIGQIKLAVPNYCTALKRDLDAERAHTDHVYRCNQLHPPTNSCDYNDNVCNELHEVAYQRYIQNMQNAGCSDQIIR